MDAAPPREVGLIILIMLRYNLMESVYSILTVCLFVLTKEVADEFKGNS